MKHFFQNIKIKYKLLIGFLLIFLVVITAMVHQYIIINNLSATQAIVKKDVELINSIKNLKYLIEYDTRILHKIINSTNAAKMEIQLQQHEQNEAKIFDNFNTIIQHSKKNKNLEYQDLIIKINNITNENLIIYKNRISDFFKTSLKQKKEFILLLEKFNLQKLHESYDDSLIAGMTTLAEEQIRLKALEKQINSHYIFIEENSELIIKQLISTEKIAVQVNQKSFESAKKLIVNSIIFMFLIIVLGTIFSFIITVASAKIISNPLNKLRLVVYKLSQGILPDKIETKSNDEIGKMGKALNELITGLRKTVEFALEIEKRNFSSDFSPLSQQDVLGNSLLDMRKSLQIANKKEVNRKIVDQHQTWANEGINMFADILRQHTENINQLTDKVIQNLIKYLDINQGGIFIYNDSKPDDIHLELVSAYAFNRKKYLDRKIKLGEGLVGAVAIEKYTIYMTDIPEDYIEIESGIGGMNPKSILIVPLKIDEEILGVIELAAFTELEPYKIELVERIAENIASTISITRINARTANLLKQSKLQTQEMHAQEEEMRQNMEEMQTTQEALVTSEQDLKKHLHQLEITQERLAQKEQKQIKNINDLKQKNSEQIRDIRRKEEITKQILQNNLDAVIVVDANGTIEFFNTAAEKLWNFKSNEIKGQNFKILLPTESNFNDDEDFSSHSKKSLESTISLEIISRNKELIPVKMNLIETEYNRVYKYTSFMRDARKELDLEQKRNFVTEKLMANELSFTKHIDMLENALIANNIAIPEFSDSNVLVVWDETYSIGLQIIDQQHKKWIDFINILYQKFLTGEAFLSLDRYINNLIEYTDYHFKFEEKYFAEFDFGATEQHLQGHQNFIKKITEFRAANKAGDPEAAYQLIIYLKSWVRRHIQFSDKKYVELFRNNGLH